MIADVTEDVTSLLLDLAYLSGHRGIGYLVVEVPYIEQYTGIIVNVLRGAGVP